MKRSRELTLRWLLALGCFAALLWCFSPSWFAFQAWSRSSELLLIEVRRGACVLEQVARPGAPLADPIHQAIQWRLLFPLLGRVLSLPAPALFGLAHVGCLVALAYVVTLLRRRGGAWFETGLFALVLGAASWFFTSTGWLGYYDAWLALALLLVGFAKRRWSMWAACLWAPWIDERFAIALPLALLCRYAASVGRSAFADTTSAERPESTGGGSTPDGPQFRWMLDVVLPLVLVGGFVFVRLGALASHSATEATISGYLAAQHTLSAPGWRIALGIWEGLRVGWLFVGFLLLLMWRSSRPTVGASANAAIALRRQGPTSARSLAVMLAAGIVLTAGVGLATAHDYSRSMTMLLPAAMLGAFALRGASVKPGWLQLAALAALALPAHHVISDRVKPIYSLDYELAALHSPPAAAMPEVFELEAIRELERGLVAQAHLDLSIAIKLSPDPAVPALRRALLAASQQRWDAARQDCETVIAHEPNNVDARFLRAHALLALGQRHEARVAFHETLAVAPAGWSLRPDVTRFMEQLNAEP